MPEIRKVSSEEMRSYASQIRTQIEQVWIPAVNEAFNQEAVLNEQWDGEAQDLFHEQWVTDEHPKYQKLTDLMNSFCEFIEKAASAYDETEDRVKAAVTKH